MTTLTWIMYDDNVDNNDYLNELTMKLVMASLTFIYGFGMQFKVACHGKIVVSIFDLVTVLFLFSDL